MTVRFFDRQDESNPLNGHAVEHDDDLLEILDGLRGRDPFFAELVGENQYNLLLGLGGIVGSVQYSRSDGRPPYLMAVGPEESPGRYLEFLIGNTLTPVPRRFGLSYEVMREVAAHFQRTGERCPGVSWEEV
jgi:hypothetical protein